MHGLWRTLGRRHDAAAIAEAPERQTLLPLPNPMIVPGERFREVYYWDTYWVIRGLLVSRMFRTATGMVYNLLHQLQTFGFVPNGRYEPRVVTRQNHPCV